MNLSESIPPPIQNPCLSWPPLGESFLAPSPHPLSDLTFSALKKAHGSPVLTHEPV
ncbi:protein of unknown function [Kyrpidia spormannii]|uniref:Uncharacterized protein n=1 Tax=Kyrpidia spormannii TaxID=2055160 RepID=A0ACA8Z4H9_9BACL|nr:protein of unknown function [Kyrpidia spormannii]